MSFITGSTVELIYASTTSGTAMSSFTSEVQINDTAGMGVQACLPADFWAPNPNQIGRGIKIMARGILSTTSSPTYTFTIRSGTAGNTTAAIILGSAALTVISGSNEQWILDGDVILTAMGGAGNNSTVRGIGQITSTKALSNQPLQVLWGGAASPGTVATVDTSIKNYINFNVACSASSPSNTITIQQLLLYGLN